mgnify:CR=1 FL=1|jgi:DNA-directed RNA polymerase subunit RPC12/RpoP
MFRVTKETIWHLTCTECKNWFSYATSEKMKADRHRFSCPHCGHKGQCELEPDTK